jgi:hypothetical protein
MVVSYKCTNPQCERKSDTRSPHPASRRWLRESLFELSFTAGYCGDRERFLGTSELPTALARNSAFEAASIKALTSRWAGATSPRWAQVTVSACVNSVCTLSM